MADRSAIPMPDKCFCCFEETSDEEANPIEASWPWGDGGRITTTSLIVCNTCRGLDCDVLNPDGCKKTIHDEALKEFPA